MSPQDSQASFWSLASPQLAERCRWIAEIAPKTVDASLRAEAGRLYAAWLDALDQPRDDFDEKRRKAALRAGLRKRTIEILVKIDRTG